MSPACTSVASGQKRRDRARDVHRPATYPLLHHLGRRDREPGPPPAPVVHVRELPPQDALFLLLLLGPVHLPAPGELHRVLIPPAALAGVPALAGAPRAARVRAEEGGERLRPEKRARRHGGGVRRLPPARTAEPRLTPDVGGAPRDAAQRLPGLGAAASDPKLVECFMSMFDYFILTSSND